MSAVGRNAISPSRYVLPTEEETHLRLKEEKILFKDILKVDPENLDALEGYKIILLTQRKFKKARIQHEKIATISRKLPLQLHQNLSECSSSCESDVSIPQVVKPLKLLNIGNSCYISSVLQSLLCVDTFVEQLRQPLERKERPMEEFEKVAAIHRELLKFINSPENAIERPSIFQLREVIFNSGLSYSLEVKGLYHQQDAACMVELILSELMPFKFKMQQHCSTEVFPGLDFVRGLDNLCVLFIYFVPPHKDLKNLIINEFENKLQECHRSFDPKDAVIIDQEKAALILENRPLTVSRYYSSERLLELQPIMVLQIQRFIISDKGTLKKRSDPVMLPEDGIIDLTPFYDAAPDQPQNALYKIKSYIVHYGKLRKGHYVAYVEKDGKYFFCNDFPSTIEEISREEFLQNTEAYLIVLERILPNEITTA